ncbi:MAG: 4Fe-4S dicluster domain-containing protein [Thermincolia bacterium]
MSTDSLIPIYIMGKKYVVPETLTIMTALEYAGYKLVRGCGCRGGYCGACATVYRTSGDYKLKVGLACQTVVEPQMYLTQIPFFPANKAIYNIQELEATPQQVAALYPELLKCMGCNSCTKICPQGLKVMEYMSMTLQGNLTVAAEESFDCLMCGLCASRCPGETVQYNIGILVRRLYAKYITPPAAHLQHRVNEIKTGKFDQEITGLMKASTDELKKMYNSREIE